MSLTPGTKLGPYEIIALIGAGGMGEVYRARDARLGREVAVKVLPASFAADPERLRRFEQEARAVATLSHPNILALYDIGQHDRAPFLVSELLEGESLREILTRGPISHRKAVDHAVQIAHGLAAAHSKNIAHRDLKPDNIFITRDGRIKILDFGLAKAILLGASASSDTRTATLSEVASATDAGTVVGTAAYMSPEQVRGGVVDGRTDIFSFGAVLYEMLTGTRAFKRDTTAETMTAILKEDPPELLESGVQIPPALDRIVRHCLEKAPEQRFQSARDLAFDLESISTLTATGSLSTKVAEKQPRWFPLAVAAVLALIAFAVWKLPSVLYPRSGAQFREVTYRRGTLGNARFTPDGQSITYTAAWEGSTPELYTVDANSVGGRPLDLTNVRLLAISKSGELAVSLDAHEIAALITPGNLARTSNSGGAPKPEIENVLDADFTPDGSALAIVRYVPDQQRCQVEFPIGKVLHRDTAVNDLRWSPNGKYLAFITHHDAYDDRGNVVIVRSTGEKVVAGPLYESAQGLAWTPSGDEVWFSSPLGYGQIHALSLSGKIRDPLTVPGRLWLRDISRDGRLLVAQGIARRGIIVSSSDTQTQRDLSWLDFGYLRAISADSKTILFEEEGAQEPTYKVFVRNTDGSSAIPIGDGYAQDLSRDKKWVLAEKLVEPVHEVWLLPVGPGEPRRISPPNFASQIAGRFFSDGKRIVYDASHNGRPVRAWLQDLNSSTPRPITPEGVIALMPSPDNRWLIAGHPVGTNAFSNARLVSVENGEPKKIQGLKADETVLGWTRDGQLYISSPANSERNAIRVDKLNPYTGRRSAWRELRMPPIGGVFPDPPLITPDGASYAFDYRLRLSDLYTVSGVR